MFSHILVAVDLSHGSVGQSLLERALRLVDPQGIVRLLHVIEDLPGYVTAELPLDLNARRAAEARVELALLADRAGPGVQVVTEARLGAAAGQILEAAAEHGADLVMIASHRPGLSDYFIGSTAARVVRHAQTSVLILR